MKAVQNCYTMHCSAMPHYHILPGNRLFVLRKKNMHMGDTLSPMMFYIANTGIFYVTH
jgi:hypothetical protein